MQHYTFHYFDAIHFKSLIFTLFLSFILIFLPKMFKSINIIKYSSFLGYCALFIKLVESFYRYFFENFRLPDTLPLHFCNFTLIIAGFYLITKKEIYFNILYFFTFGAVASIILPGINYYNYNFFVYLFMINHAFEIIATAVGFIYLNGKISKNGMRISIATVLLLFIISYFYNNIFHTNFMFLNDYVAPFFSFIKPFYLYRIILILSFIIIIYVLFYIYFFINKLFFEKPKGENKI